MIYLTYNDQPSGVYSSQVNDVCNFLNGNLNGSVKLVAFISLRNFGANRKKIRSEVNNAWVLPALPKAKYWKFSSLVFTLICFFTGERKVIARNVLATLIALTAKKMGAVHTICLDGRGAIAAEWTEYEVVPDEKMVNAIFGQEKRAVLQSDFKLAVSAKLVDYWRDSFGYKGSEYVVIPCTLNSGFRSNYPGNGEITKQREKEGFAIDDIVLVYSGSTAGWQSFAVLGDILGRILSSDKKFKLLFLAGEDDNIHKMKERFPGQVTNKWVGHDEVQKILSACDYGILYREPSVTNKVASPTKFAEYLSAGLPVLISENLGDYSDFVCREGCGMVLSGDGTPQLPKPSEVQKLKAIELANSHFTKMANKSQFETLINFMKNN